MKNYNFSLPLFLLFFVLMNTSLFAQKAAIEKPAPEGGIMIYFDSGKSSLDAKAKSALDAALNATKAGESISVMVYGHTDNYGSDEPNTILSRKRCYAAWDYIMSKRKYDIKKGEVSMNGEYIPTADNKDEQNRAKNRRVYVVIQKL